LLPAFNEVVQLAIWVGLGILLTRRVSEHGRRLFTAPWRRAELVVGQALALGALTAMAIRVGLSIQCARGGCYTGSDLAIGGAPPHLGSRLISVWAGPASTLADLTGIDGKLIAAAMMLALLALAVAAIVVDRRSGRSADGNDHSSSGPAPPRPVEGICAGLILIACGTVMGASSTAVQEANLPWSSPWREAVVTWPGAALVVAGVLGVAIERLPRLKYAAALAGVAALILVGLGLSSAAENRATALVWQQSEVVANHIAMGHEFAEFSRGRSADLRRCSMFAKLDAFAAAGTMDPWQVERTRDALNSAAQQRYQTAFCTGG
jgi:hypothetical protein